MLSHTVQKRLEQLPKLSVAGKRVNGLFKLMRLLSDFRVMGWVT